jgi:hypothetical protein
MIGNFSEFEPNFESSFDFDTEMKQAVLDEALKRFSDTVLTDDTLYGLIRNKLLEDSEIDAYELPEFSVGPVIKDGTRSICITTSMQADAGEERNDNGDVALLTFSFGTMKYIHVCDYLINDETGVPSIAVKKSFV